MADEEPAKGEEPNGLAQAASEEEEDLFGGDEEDQEMKPNGKFPKEVSSKGAVPDVDAPIPRINGASQKEVVAQVDAPIPRNNAKRSSSVSVEVPSPTGAAELANAGPPGNTLPPAKNGEAAKFGLPDGVTIPPSVTPALLQGRLLETLRGLPLQLINDALVEYDDAVQIKGEAIRNHGAYLYGVVKRYVSVQERAAAGEGQGVLPMGPELTPAVNERLQKLVREKFCTEEEMNEKVKSKIRMLSEKDAIFAIDELASVERSQIRNFGSYFMGILNRYMRGDGNGPGTWAKKQEAKRQGAEVRSQGRQDDRRREDRFQRGRDNDPQFRRARDQNDHNESYRRERSRERHDQAHRKNPNEWRDQYDPRQQPAAYAGQLQHPSMGGIPGNPPPPPPRPVGVPGVGAYAQQPYIQTAPGPQMAYGQPSPMNQPPYSPAMGGAQPPSSYSQPLQHRAVMGTQQAPQQYTQQVVQPSYTNPQGGMGLPPGMPGNPPTNSYGVSGNQPMMGQQPPQSYTNPSYAPNSTSQNRFPQQTPQGQDRWQTPQATSRMQNPSGQGVPVDILGLADKAASAVQALQSQNKFLPPSVAPLQQPVASAYPGAPSPYAQPQMSVPQAYAAGNQPQPPQITGQGGKARRRTTASMTELPITVQYAVQNLQATGQIDGPLDDGMLGMVKDLPENLALQALQKFSSIDKNTMRNKTAYLAGVLRRELEKINRR